MISEYNVETDTYEPTAQRQRRAPTAQVPQPANTNQQPLPENWVPYGNLAYTGDQAAATSWGDMYRNLANQRGGGGGGAAPPQPEDITPATVTVPTLPTVPTLEGQQIDWQWQGLPGAGGGGGGAGGGGGGGRWDVAQVDLGQYAITPEQQAQLEALQAAGISDPYGQYTQQMYGKVGEFMERPTGYSPDEYAMLEGRAADEIYGQGRREEEALRQQLGQQGLLGGGREQEAMERLRESRAGQMSDVRRDLALQDMAMRRQGAMDAMNVGMQWGAQQGQMEAQMMDMQNQIAMNNKQIEYEVSRGNVDRAQQIALENQRLQAQSDQLNAAAQNEAMMLRNQLATQRGIAGMQTRAQREIAMNQMTADVAAQNAQLAQQTGQFNIGNIMDIGQMGYQGNLQAALANAGYGQEAAMFNAQRQDAWRRAQASAANAGARWRRNLQMQGVQQDIAQQRYNDALALQLLGLNQSWGQNLFNQAYGYGGDVYSSNPNQWADPYAAAGGYGGGYGNVYA